MSPLLAAALAVSFIVYLFAVFLVLRAVGRRVPRWARNLLTLIALTIVPVAVGTEIHVRALLWKQYQDLDTASIIKNEELTWGEVDRLLGLPTTTETPGLFKPNREIHIWWVPVKTAKIALHKASRTNNLGFISDKKYEYGKKPGEFRILFLGDSMTGCGTMNTQWVDAVEDLLNADPQLKPLGKTFKTYNLGWPGGGFPHFAKSLEKFGPKIEPDLVVVNYIESDFPRFEQATSNAWLQEKVRGGFAMVDAPGVTKPMLLNVVKTGWTYSIYDSECYQFYQYFMDPSVVEDEATRRYIIETTRRAYSIGKTFLTLYPYAYHYFAGHEVAYSNWRHPEWFHIPEADEGQMLEQAKSCIQRIVKVSPRTLVTLMPLWSDAYPTLADYGRTKKLQKLVPDLPIEVMRERFPFKSTTPEKASAWYNLPWDGHMSEEGGRMYARAMTDHLRTQLLSPSKGPAVQ